MFLLFLAWSDWIEFQPDLPGLPPVPVVYDKSRILAMNGTLVDEAATAGSGSRPSDVIGGGGWYIVWLIL